MYLGYVGTCIELCKKLFKNILRLKRVILRNKVFTGAMSENWERKYKYVISMNLLMASVQVNHLSIPFLCNSLFFSDSKDAELMFR